MQDQLTRRITIGDAAQVLGVSKDTVRRLISAGELQAYRIGRGPRSPIRLDLAAVEAYALPIPTARVAP